MLLLLAQTTATAPSPPSWTGSIPTWLLLVLAIGVAFRLSRGGGGSAVSELSKANEVLKKSLDQERELSRDKEHRIAALEAKTDVVLAVRPLMEELDRKSLDRFEVGQRMAQEHHDATLAVLQAMTVSLNGAVDKEST